MCTAGTKQYTGVHFGTRMIFLHTHPHVRTGCTQLGASLAALPALAAPRQYKSLSLIYAHVSWPMYTQQMVFA